MDDPGFDVLLDRARSGDEAAFAAIYRDVQPRLLRYLLIQSPDRAEDVAADTWLEVARSVGAFAGVESGFRSWVFTIARSRLVDGIRHDARRPVRLVDEAYELDRLAGAGLLDGSVDVGARLEEADSTRRAIALVRTLPPDQAEVVLLRVVAGLETAEVAAMLGKTAGSVRVLAHRGLRRLARTLAAATPTAAAAASAAEARVAPSGRHDAEEV